MHCHKNGSIQNEVDVESLRIISDRGYLFYPWSRVVPERVYALVALNEILSYIRYVLAFRTELLQAIEIWYVLV